MKLYVSASPHVRDTASTRRIMTDVSLALLPAVIASYFIFGARALATVFVSVAACVLFEYLALKAMKRDTKAAFDMSAVVTGILLAFNVPAGIPIWMVILGAFFAVVFCKQMFGGIGDNFVNPAIAARAILMISFPAHMTDFVIRSNLVQPGPAIPYDMVSMPTTLVLIEQGGQVPSLLDQFLGVKAGVLGEVSIVALLIGAAYLLIRRVIDLWIPLTFIGTTLIFVGLNGQNVLYHLLSGGLVLGAFFMATDYVTSPITRNGKIIFGIGCGLITGLIRIFGSSPEGVSFAILFMNVLTPHINNWTRQKPIGGRVNVAKE